MLPDVGFGKHYTNHDPTRPNFVFSSDVAEKVRALVARSALGKVLGEIVFTINIELNALLVRDRNLRATELIKENVVFLAKLARAVSGTTGINNVQGLIFNKLRQSIEPYVLRSNEVFVATVVLTVLEFAVEDRNHISIEFLKDANYALLLICDENMLLQLETYIKQRFVDEMEVAEIHIGHECVTDSTLEDSDVEKSFYDSMENLLDREHTRCVSDTIRPEGSVEDLEQTRRSNDIETETIRFERSDEDLNEQASGYKDIRSAGSTLDGVNEQTTGSKVGSEEMISGSTIEDRNEGNETSVESFRHETETAVIKEGSEPNTESIRSDIARNDDRTTRSDIDRDDLFITSVDSIPLVASGGDSAEAQRQSLSQSNDCKTMLAHENSLPLNSGKEKENVTTGTNVSIYTINPLGQLQIDTDIASYITSDEQESLSASSDKHNASDKTNAPSPSDSSLPSGSPAPFIAASIHSPSQAPDISPFESPFEFKLNTIDEEDFIKNMNNLRHNEEYIKLDDLQEIECNLEEKDMDINSEVPDLKPAVRLVPSNEVDQVVSRKLSESSTFVSPGKQKSVSRMGSASFSMINHEDNSGLEYAFRINSPTVPTYIKSDKKFKFIKIGKVQKFVNLFEEKKEPGSSESSAHPTRTSSPKRQM